MGMIFGMVSLTPGQIRVLRAAPALASDLMYADQEEGSELRIAGSGSVEARLDLDKS